MDSSTVGDHFIFWRPDLGETEANAREGLSDVAVVFSLADAAEQYCRLNGVETGAAVRVRNGRTGETRLFGVTAKWSQRVHYNVEELEW